MGATSSVSGAHPDYQSLTNAIRDVQTARESGSRLYVKYDTNGGYQTTTNKKERIKSMDLAKTIYNSTRSLFSNPINIVKIGSHEESLGVLKKEIDVVEKKESTFIRKIKNFSLSLFCVKENNLKLKEYRNFVGRSYNNASKWNELNRKEKNNIKP